MASYISPVCAPGYIQPCRSAVDCIKGLATAVLAVAGMLYCAVTTALTVVSVLVGWAAPEVESEYSSLGLKQHKSALCMF